MSSLRDRRRSKRRSLDEQIAQLAGARPWLTVSLVRNQAWKRGAACPVTGLPGWSSPRAAVAYGETLDGRLISFASGEPRIVPGRGQLIELSRSNYVTYSQQFDNAAWAKSRSSVSANAATAPDGTLTADKIVEDSTASNSHRIYQGYTKAASAIQYTASVYFKAAERTFAHLRCASVGETNSAGVGINLTNGSLGTVYGSGFTSISAVAFRLADGWWRVALTFTSDTDTSVNTFLHTATSSAVGGLVYSGDGASGVYAWQVDLQAGAFPTSPIVTTSTSATRPADVPVLDLLNPGWYDVASQPELSGFSPVANTTGWTAYNSATLSAVSNALRVTGNGATLFPKASRAVTVTSGKLYYVSFDYSVVVNPINVFLNAGAVAGSGSTFAQVVASSGSGTLRGVVRATSSTLYIEPVVQAIGGSVDFSNFSVKEVPAEQVLDYPCTIWAEFERVVDTGSQEYLIWLDQGSSNERAALRVNTGDQAETLIVTGGVVQATVAVMGALSIGVFYKMAGRVATNDVQTARDGTLATADTSCTTPSSPTTVYLGQGNGVASPCCGYLRAFSIIKGGRPDANLTRLAA